MPKDTTAIETTNANKVFDLPVKLEPGHVNTMSFAQDSISQMHLTPGKELQISFTDGSKVQIENFQELVNSAQSCGRDTIIQLSDNTIIYPEELNSQLSKGPVAFGADPSTTDVLTFNEPPAGQIVEKTIQPGHEYKMGFDLDHTASAAQAGQNLILTFKDGGILVMKNYFSSMGSELPPALTLADGSVIDSTSLLTSCKLVETPSFAQTVADETAAATEAQTALRKGVADAEPAAGEEDSSGQVASASKKAASGAPDVEPAAGEEAVADIEPAAGNPGGLSGGRGGYGFASEPSSVSLAGLSSIGAIGATSLLYTTPNSRLGPTGTNQAAAVVNANPFAAASQVTLDESGTHSISSKVNFNFGSDGPSTTVPPVQATGDFAFGGSSGANLTSNGQAVTVTRVGDTYTGTAGGSTVFTFTIQSDGTYTFVQSKALDHADGTDANDVIVLNFGVVGTDKDGDQALTSVSVNVLDDAPVAVDDTNSVGSSPVTVIGNVLTNDSAGFDGSATVTAITFNGTTVAVPSAGSTTVVGTYGTLVIQANGAYSYTSSNTALGTDQFTYTMKDYDGDTATANLSVTVTDLDTVPVVGDATSTVDETSFGATISVSGAVSANFLGDTPGTITGTNSFSSGGSKAGGNLTSQGVAVVVTQIGNVYTGKAGVDTVFTLTVNSDGTYTYVQSKPLDHADKSNPDDIINLNFGIIGTDADGDTDTGTITINVKDDGPLAVADTGTVNAANPTITGNVTSNDDFGSDGKPAQAVTKVVFNGTTYTVPADGSNVTITSANGKLTINQSGQYSYTSTTTTGGVDTYSYVIQDKDGDTDTVPATSTLKITIDDVDYTPTVTSDAKTVDETNLGPITITGAVSANYFSDGPGSIAGSTFSSAGSKLGNSLTSNGVAVVVTQVGNVYTGKAGNDTVFTMTINANGTYSFVLNKPLDHADKSNPNDAIDLNFAIIATDADGDVATGNIKVTVLDDGPTAVDDVTSIAAGSTTATGNVISNDSFGQDGQPAQAVTKITFNGVTYTVPAAGNITVTGTYGSLSINKDGVYTYTSAGVNGGGVDKFTYTIADKDGDTDTSASQATLTVNVNELDQTPTVTSDAKTVDETNLGPITINGAVTANYFSDGPGTINGSNTFTSAGSKLGGNLTSGGVAVTVTQVGNVYTGKAGNDTVFTLTVNTDGTYSFVLNKPLDHADKSNPNDAIDLNFGIVAKDADGDVANGTIKVTVLDDGPTAVNDTATLAVNVTTATGNVVSNDNFGHDGQPSQAVTKITFNGVTYTVPAAGSVTVTGSYGTLSIDKNGAYTYTSANVNGGGVDKFTYTIADKDGDTDTSASQATLTVTVNELDQTPTVTSDAKTVDETNMNPSTSIAGSVTANYFGDGPGTINGSGSFSSSGSQLNNTLTSHGVAVVVTQVGNVYTGTANGVNVFTLTINTNGSYNFVLNQPLDHADKSNPNDAIDLNFGIVAKDADGDTANGNIKITVLDDGPTIGTDTQSVDESNMTSTTSTSVTGHVAVNYGHDGAGSVTTTNQFTATGSVLNGTLTSHGVAVVVTQVGNVYTGKAGNDEVFKFTLNSDGSYNFVQSKILDHADPKDPNDVITLGFGVKATDADGDTATNVVHVNVLDDGPTVVPAPSVAVCVNNYIDNVYLPTKDYAVVITMTADTTGQGNQALHIVLSGVDPSWVFTPVTQTSTGYAAINLGVYDAAAKTWTLDLAPGDNFDGKFYFKPTSDVDLNHITFTATVTENGQSAVQSDDFNIVVNGVDTHAMSAMSLYSDDSALGADSLDISHTTSTSTSTSANDNVTSYASVVESDNDAAQSAINTFVYSTSTETTTVSHSTSSSESSAYASSVATTAVEELHQAQSQVA